MLFKDSLKKSKKAALSICKKSLKVKKSLTKNKEKSELKIINLLSASIIDNKTLSLHKVNIKILDMQLKQNDFLFDIGTAFFDHVKDSNIESHIKSLVFSMEEQLEASRIVYLKNKKEFEEKEKEFEEKEKSAQIENNDGVLISHNDFEKKYDIQIEKTKLNLLKSFISELNDFKDVVKYSLPRSSWKE